MQRNAFTQPHSPATLLTRLPRLAGVCLKSEHYAEILERQPEVGWFEIHAENYLGAGGAPLHYLEQIRQRYALSIHGVGLSIGSTDGMDPTHLKRVATLVERFDPESFSEHLAWSTHGSEFLSDLLPVPYNREVEDLVCSHIDQIQDTLQRPMLLENPSNYLALESSTLPETQLLTNIVNRTGCGLLLDVNNVYVSAHNCNYDAQDYIRQLPHQCIGELHLAGHSIDNTDPAERVLIDAHDRPVCNDVWSLYQFALDIIGETPTLIEWDTLVPTWSVLHAEMQKADNLLSSYTSNHAHY